MYYLYYVKYDCDGLGKMSNQEVIGPYETTEAASAAHPREDNEYRAGGYDDAPVFRTNSYNCLIGPFRTFEEAEANM